MWVQIISGISRVEICVCHLYSESRKWQISSKINLFDPGRGAKVNCSCDVVHIIATLENACWVYYHIECIIAVKRTWTN